MTCSFLLSCVWNPWSQKKGQQRIYIPNIHLHNYLPSWELTYLLQRHFWIDEFPFPKVGYVIVPWRVMVSRGSSQKSSVGNDILHDPRLHPRKQRPVPWAKLMSSTAWWGCKPLAQAAMPALSTWRVGEVFTVGAMVFWKDDDGIMDTK